MTKRSILITGCSSGIGQCLASGLQQRGFRVLASARQDADCAALERSGLEALRLDLADSNSIGNAFAAALERTDGRLFALINNGAYGQPGAVEDLPREVLRTQFETNLFGTHELTRLAVAVMRSRGEGRIIQISSILGLVCLPYRGAYNASKYALEALTDTLRMELRGSGIHTSLIEPGAIHSRFRANALKMFEAHIDVQASAHRGHYEAVLARLKGTTEPPMSLPPEAVLRKVVHALSSRRPRLRYRVTGPAHALAFLKRVLPDRTFDWLVHRLAGR